MVDPTQSLDTIEVKSKKDAMPAPNHSHIRLYGHPMSPFAERVRLLLHNTPFQDCQVNMESRAPWHYNLNNGFVPILEVPDDEGTVNTILESRIIIDFLNDKLNLKLYSECHFEKTT